jgi:NIPSNAP
MLPKSCPIVEFRRYTLHPGQRDVLIELFEHSFVEPQEELGMELPAMFRVEGAPDRFVWLRGFADMESRAVALDAFYGGPVWQANRTAANATMIDSDDVHLLHPTGPIGGFPSTSRAPLGAQLPPAARFFSVTWRLEDRDEAAFAARFERLVLPALRAAGAVPVATLATEHSPNNFPALPVHGDGAFVCFARLDRGTTREAIEQALAPHRDETTELLLLLPTERSKLR